MTELSFLSRRDPEKATPDNELLGILGGFAQEWFGSLDVGLVAKRAWEIIEPLKNDLEEGDTSNLALPEGGS